MPSEPLDPLGPQYKARFVARIKEKIVGIWWTDSAAENAAEMEYEGMPEEYRTNDPESDADECLSYWADDGDDE